MYNFFFNTGPFVALLNAIMPTVCIVRKPSDYGRHDNVSCPTFELTDGVEITLLASYTNSATEACFRNRGFPVEILGPGDI